MEEELLLWDEVSPDDLPHLTPQQIFEIGLNVGYALAYDKYNPEVTGSGKSSRDIQREEA